MDIRYLKGVGEKRAELFNKKGIKTVDDLLYFFPRAHEDRTQIKKIEDCIEGETVCVSITVFSPVRERYIRKNMLISQMAAADESGRITAIWYNNRFLKDKFEVGGEYILYGKIGIRLGAKQILNPIFEKVDKQHYTGKIVPIYPLTGNLTQKILQSAMEDAIKARGEITEYIPADIREKYKIAEINYCMENIHFPESFNSYNTARERFVFEELLTLQLALFNHKTDKSKAAGIVFDNVSGYIREFCSSLPYELTKAQKRTMNEIAKDLKNSYAMNRLIQGDVGSGKTVIAAATIFLAAKNGVQSAMMAPTEILASQHFESLNEFFKNSNIKVVRLAGGMKAKEKRETLKDIADGTAQVVIGTHAIIQESVVFKNLGLVVADEQHRFGVEQRAKLVAKGNSPHMLLMSATPIPRTLALILYGDLDVSVIDELPPGRKSVKTYAVKEDMRKRIYNFVQKEVQSGAQAYIVCPLVEETEKSDLKNAVDLCDRLKNMFPQYKIEVVHGKMKQKLKDEAMSSFVSGETKILVSTTVIEVGVNVPNASVMVVENAERFGLSQLHQLRGRVGRGNRQSYCILFNQGTGEIADRRMETMTLSNDGFYISEQDLKLRGPGDFFGTRQHGLPEMRIANLFEDRDILKMAQAAAADILDEDSDLSSDKYALLKARCEKMLTENIAMN